MVALFQYRKISFRGDFSKLAIELHQLQNRK